MTSACWAKALLILMPLDTLAAANANQPTDASIVATSTLWPWQQICLWALSATCTAAVLA